MIKAVGKRLIVKVPSEETKEIKGIIIPVDNLSPIRAEVIALGIDVDQQVIEGDIVILPPRTGTSVEIEGQKYLAIYEDQILAIEG